MFDKKNEERRNYDEVTESIEKNQEAQEKNKTAREDVEAGITALQEELKNHGVTWEEATAKQDENTESAN